jgi:D-arabinose 1-dehydrogenase-like Zn-dependent alcohol dehydrogenase
MNRPELNMLSWQVTDWGRPLQAVVRDVPRPAGTEVLLRVQACGVCHSDVHLRDGVYDLGTHKARLSDLGFRLPLTLGHEIVGEVVAAGPDAQVELGASRVVFPWIGCGQCRHCVAGREIDCDHPASVGIRRNGGYSTHVLVPHGRYLFDYDGIAAPVAAASACSGITAYSALKKLPACRPDDTVALIGAGGLGLAALGLIGHLCPARVVMVDNDPRKLELARGLAHELIDIREEGAAEQVRRLSGDGLAGVIDFVGVPQTFEWASSTVRRGATIVVVGLFGGAVTLPLPRLPMRNLTIAGSYVGTMQEFAELLALLRQGGVPPTPMITQPLSEIDGLLDRVHAGRVDGRYVVTPPPLERGAFV